MARQVVLALPFEGRWLVRNSPARRVPSHGTDLLGERYAIDFVGVGERHRTSLRWDWRTLLAAEPPERFVGFGRPILAPATGVVVAVHDGRDDHTARRSPVTALPYLLGQVSRLREGVDAVAGNHLVLALSGGGFAGLAHLRSGSFRVGLGDRVAAGQPVAECGNSGNSIQPHLHVQVTDRADLSVARGVPMAFRRFREWPRGGGPPQDHDVGIPGEGAVVEQLDALSDR